VENRLKVYRAMRDITQENLAKVVGVSRQTIIAIERGNYNPSLELAFKIVRFFEVRIEDVFIYDDTSRARASHT
jgi:putative transcriptional regulator